MHDLSHSARRDLGLAVRRFSAVNATKAASHEPEAIENDEVISGMLAAVLWGGLAAASLLIGYYLATRGPSKRATGLIMGIGAGALIAAIAYELVPATVLGGWAMALAFGLGAMTFFLGDWAVDRRGGEDRKDITGSAESGSGAAIFVGTLLDNVPESIILGMGLALGGAINQMCIRDRSCEGSQTLI